MFHEVGLTLFRRHLTLKQRRSNVCRVPALKYSFISTKEVKTTKQNSIRVYMRWICFPLQRFAANC